MSRWIMVIISFVSLLLLTGNCRCDNYEVPRPEHEYDPVKAAKVDSVIEHLTAKVATADNNIEELKAKLADLEEKLANKQATNALDLEEFNKQVVRLGILEQQIIELSTSQAQAIKEKFDDLNNQIAELQAALNEESEKIKNLATKADLQAEKLEREEIVKAAMGQIFAILQRNEGEIQELYNQLSQVNRAVLQAKNVAEEADRKATEALALKEKAQEAEKVAKEAKEKAEEAKEAAKKAEGAKEAAEKAQRAAQKAEAKLEEVDKKAIKAQNEASEAKEAAEMAQRAAQEAEAKLEEVDKKAIKAQNEAGEAKEAARLAQAKVEQIETDLQSSVSTKVTTALKSAKEGLKEGWRSFVDQFGGRTS